jgi:F0F1-type ATP synthase membrane subunit b/b'
MVEKAYREAEGMIERAKLDVAKQQSEMVVELRENISKVVVHAVETILGNVIDKELDHKIILETEKRVNIQEPV